MTTLSRTLGRQCEALHGKWVLGVFSVIASHIGRLRALLKNVVLVKLDPFITLF